MLLCLMLGREVIPAHFLHLDWSPADTSREQS